jgi:hypothetical protein
VSNIGIVASSYDLYNPSNYDYDLATTWNSDGLSVDNAGHVRITVNGQAFIHPVAAAQYGLAALEEYERTFNPVWLHRSETAVSDALATVEPNGLIPQNYPWFGRDGRTFTTPAFSAMTQGQTLSLVVRLYQATGDPVWKKWADRLFATLAAVGSDPSSAVTFVDKQGYLWLEEYSLQCPGRVLNGDIFAAFGVLDYYRLTHDPSAAVLFDEAATTVLHYLPAIRRPGQLSVYGVTQQFVRAFYHRIHIMELQALAAATGEKAFTRWATLLIADERTHTTG